MLDEDNVNDLSVEILV
jgi:hypothetical protein